MSARAPQGVDSGSVSFLFDDNRIFATISFRKPDGSVRRALAFVDLGDPVPIMTAALASELGLGTGGSVRIESGAMQLDPYRGPVITTHSDLGRAGPNGRPTSAVETTLPADILKDYLVTIDYADHRLALARAGAPTLDGVSVPIDVNPITGLVSVRGRVADHVYDMAIDIGSAYTWFRADTVQRWTTLHPEWARGRDEFDWYSVKTPKPVIGWIGGKVLKNFRLTIDYPHHITWWARQHAPAMYDLDQVGVTLQDDGTGYIISGVAERNGGATVQGVAAGDRLTRIEGVMVDSLTRGAVFRALSGPPGDIKRLTVRRGGTTLTISAPVTRF